MRFISYLYTTFISSDIAVHKENGRATLIISDLGLDFFF